MAASRRTHPASQARPVLRGEASTQAVLTVAVALTVAFLMLVTNALDVWENNRARYMVDPFIWLLLWLTWRWKPRW